MAATMIATDRNPWYDVETGVVDRSIFSDPEIYRGDGADLRPRLELHLSRIADPRARLTFS